MEQQEVANNDQEVANGEGQTTKQSEGISLETLSQRLQELESSKERLESESKKWKSRYKELESTNEEAQSRRLEEEGKYQELLELEKNKAHTYSKQMQDLKKKALQKELRIEVSRYARDAFDLEDVVNSLPIDLLEIDEDNMSVKGVAEAVAKVKESKHWLFDNKKVPTTMAARPENGVPSPKTLAEMSNTEKQNLLKSLIT